MYDIYDDYKVKVISEDRKGNREEKIEIIRAKNDLQAMDKANKYYKEKLKRIIIDLEVI